MKIKNEHTLLHYEAPDACWVEVDESCPLMQSITVPTIEEETIDWS